MKARRPKGRRAFRFIVGNGPGGNGPSGEGPGGEGPAFHRKTNILMHNQSVVAENALIRMEALPARPQMCGATFFVPYFYKKLLNVVSLCTKHGPRGAAYLNRRAAQTNNLPTTALSLLANDENPLRYSPTRGRPPARPIDRINRRAKARANNVGRRAEWNISCNSSSTG